MRDTMNDRIEPAGEEDLVYPDESSEFFSAEEAEEELKAERENKNDLEKRMKSLLKDRENLFINTSPARNYNRHR